VKKDTRTSCTPNLHGLKSNIKRMGNLVRIKLCYHCVVMERWMWEQKSGRASEIEFPDDPQDKTTVKIPIDYLERDQRDASSS
jgi:hypothetical protein